LRKKCLDKWVHLKDHALSFISSEPFDQSAGVKELTPFAGMSHREYMQWFPKYRVKKKALPVYYDYRHGARNSIKDEYVHLRQTALVFLEKTGLRRRLNI
jgi:hypothetical protein